MDIHAFRNNFAPVLEQAVQQHISAFQTTASDPFLGASVAHVAQLVAGGKRLRPYLAAVGYAAGGGTDANTVLRLGVGLELFHVFCLIHDDIIDKAATRRGVPTVETWIATQLRTDDRRGDTGHLAKSSAILIGDLVFSWANQHVSMAALACSSPQDVLTEYHGMVDEVVVGQMIDVDTMTRDEHAPELLERKMYLKTAGYSFVRPLRIGLLASGNATPEMLAAMTAMGTPMGLAFQLQDDLLDIVSTPDVLGKPTLSDICDGQQTLLTAFIAKHGTNEEQSLLRRVMRGEGGGADVEALRAIMVNGGAVAHVEQRIDALWAEARSAVAEAPMPEDIRQSFTVLIAALVARAR